EKHRIDEFFRMLHTPVDFEKEEGAGSDNLQAKVMGMLCLIYGGFVLLLMAIPNSLTGRMCFEFCGGTIAGIGALLHFASRGGKAKLEADARGIAPEPPGGFVVMPAGDQSRI